MSQELIYTSAPKGLKPGSRGFCTVASTQGMPAPLGERLESLSGYRPIYPAGSPSAAENPVSYGHWRVTVGGKTYSVLSRVAFAGFDYTQRSNKLAHHLVLDAAEQTSAGPAWVLMQEGVMESAWSGEPRLLPSGRPIPRGDNPLRVCESWAALAGDAGWAGALVEAFVLDASKPAYIIYEPGTDLLPLINEAIALLPPHLRWQVTFNTYFTELPAGLTCTWRCCVAGTPAAAEAGRLATSGVVVDLRQPGLLEAQGRYVSAARTGAMPAEEAPSLPEDFDDEPWSARPGRRSAAAAVATSVAPVSEYDVAVAGAETAPGVSPRAIPGDGGLVVVERTRTSPFFWAIAILWPVVVAVAVWFLYLPKPHNQAPVSMQDHVSSEGATDIQNSPQEASVPAINADADNPKVGAAGTATGTANSDIKQYPQDGPAVSTNAATTAQSVQSPSELAATASAISPATTQSAESTHEMADVAATEPDPSNSTPPQVRRRAAHLLEYTGDSEAIELVVGGRVKHTIALHFPRQQTRYKCERTSSGLLVTMLQGLKGNIEIMRMDIVDGKVMYRWYPKGTANATPKEDFAILRFASLAYETEQDGERRHQLYEYLHRRVAYAEAKTALELPLEYGLSMQLSSVPPNVKVTGNGNEFKYRISDQTNPSLYFSIEWKRGELESTWNAQRQAAAEKSNEADQQLQKFDTIQAQIDSKEFKQLDPRVQAQIRKQQPLSSRENLVEDKEKKAALLGWYDNMPPTRISFSLPNQVELATVVLSQEGR